MVVNVYSNSVTSNNISRQYLLAWINDSLEANFSKIEELSSGAAYAQFTQMLFPDKINLTRIKWNSKQPIDWISNWKVVQTAWKTIGIDKPIPVELLLKGKFQDNLEFLQWFRKFYDSNWEGGEYDAVGARGGEALPNAVGKVGVVKGRGSVQGGVAGKAKTSSTSSSGPLTKTGPSSASGADGKKVPSNSAKSNGSSKEGGVVGVEEEWRRKVGDLEEQNLVLASNMIQCEGERDYYYNRLQQIEALVGGLTDEDSLKVNLIKKILYGGAEESGVLDLTSDVNNLTTGDAKDGVEDPKNYHIAENELDDLVNSDFLDKTTGDSILNDSETF
uniref:Calponin-homology (CH) domain-containing protein n=1 Tax=Rhabditophanes sp. KR3021 TaxID=114890 RepID=A0AC35U9C2_9BILA